MITLDTDVGGWIKRWAYMWIVDSFICGWFEARLEIGDDMDVPTQLLSKFERHIVAILCRDGTVG